MNGSAGSQHDSIATTSSAILQPASPAAAVFAGLADSYEENSAVGLLPRNDGAVVPVHHATLLRFLQEQPGNITLTDEGRSNKARDKLTRLSRAQFSELSTDVYDELLRRGVPATSANSAFLLPRDHYHPKRNQARQKLASLPTLRFKDLVADVFFELQRRFPQVTQAQRPLEPEKRSFQSNTIIPNKSTMVEDDGGDDPSRPQTGRSHISAASSNHHSRRSNQTTSPPPRMSSRSDLSSIRESPSYRGASMLSGDSTSYGEAPRDSDQTIKLRNRIRALEDQLGTTSAKLGSLQEENQKLKEARLNPGTDPCLPEIEQELDQARSHIRSLQLELQNSKSAISPDAILREENKRLHEELEEQQRITEDVRQETTDLLDEVRKLAELEGGSWEEKERLERANEELKVELTEWKARYTKVKTQLRNLRATSLFLTQSLSQTLVHENAPFISETGKIDDINMTKFQMAIDEILLSARSPNPSGVLDCMKGIVLSIRGLTKNLEEMSPDDSSNSERIQKLRTRMSATANNLMTAAKNHATANGLSPVSLLDAAASHLTSTVIELVKIVGVRPTDLKTPPDSNEAEETGSLTNGTSPFSAKTSPTSRPQSSNTPLRGPGNANNRTSNPPRSRNGAESDVVMSPVSPISRTNTRIKASLSELLDLKAFLEVQTSCIVESIQKLLSQIRSETDTNHLLRHIGEIVHIVTAVVAQSQKTMLAVPTFKNSANPVVQKLSGCAERLAGMKSHVDQNGHQVADKAYKQKLAGVAFDTAKQTKELVRLVESLDSSEI